MSHDRFEELVVAHAVDGTLDAEGSRELIPHLAGCASCRALLVDLEAATEALALTVDPVPPPEGLEHRIVGAVRAAAPNARSGRLGRARRMLGVAAAIATLALGSTSLVLYNTVERERRDDRRVEAAMDVLIDPDARIARLTSTEAGSSGVVAFDRDGTGVLIVEGLAPTPAGKVHELWLITDGKPRAVDVFTVSAGRVVVPVQIRDRGADAAAITLEDGPLGSPVPTGDMLLTGQIA